MSRLLFSLLAVALLSTLLSNPSIAQSQMVTDGSTPSALAAGGSVGSYSLTGFETVNPYNGGLNFSLPLLQVGGRGGAGYAITLRIDHKWIIRKEINPGHQANFYPTPNWVSPDNGVLTEIEYGVGKLTARYGITRNQSHTLARLTFTAPDGTEYELRDQQTNGTPHTVNWTDCLNQNFFSRGRVFVTADGSSATFIADPEQDVRDLCGFDASSTPAGDMFLNDGTRFRLDTSGRVVWMRDRNGNLITFGYGFNSDGKRATTITDSLGRVITITESSPVVIAYKGFGAVDRTIKVHTTDLGNALRGASTQEFQLRTQNSLFPGLNNPVGGTVSNPRVVGSVEMPDGRGYGFKYNDFGELARVELPAGGAIEYDYAQGLTDGPVSGMFTDANNDKQIYRRVVERRVYPDGGAGSGFAIKQTYSRPESSTSNLGYTDVLQCSSGPAKGECETGSARLSYERHYYYGSPRLSFNKRPVDYEDWQEGREYETRVYDPQSEALLRKVQETWQQPVEGATWPLTSVTTETNPGAKPNNPQITQTVTTLLDTNQAIRQTYSYDRYGNRTDIYEYDYGAVGSGTYGPLLRHSHTDFVTEAAAGGATYDFACDPTTTCSNQSIIQNGSQNIIHLRGLPRAAQVYSVNPSTGSETIAARSEMRYDEAAYPLFTYEGVIVPGWDEPATSARGNLTSVRSFIDASASLSPEQACPAGVCLETHARYDQLGNVRYSWDARGNRSEVTYGDSYCNDNGASCGGTFVANAYAFPTWAKTPAPDQSGTYGSASGLTSSTVYDYYSGLVYSVTNANHLVTRFEYEGQPAQLDRLKAVVRQDGSRTDYEYSDTAGNLYVRTLTDLDGTRRLKSEQHFDKLGRPFRSVVWENQEGNTPWVTRDVLYDKLGRVWKVTNPYRSTDTSPAMSDQRPSVEKTYDALNRLRLVKNTGDAASVITDYDGQRVLVTDPAGKQRISQTDALGRIIEVWEVTPNETAKYPGIEPLSFTPTSGVAAPAMGYRTEYLYDVLGNLRRVKQGTQERFYAYDSLGRLLRSKNPEQENFAEDAANGFPSLNDPVTGNDHWSEGYVYDENGNLTKKRDARNVVTSYSYDALNRNNTISYATPGESGASATADVFRFYDNAASGANGKGRIHRIEQGGTTGSATYVDQYDAMGRPLVYRQKFKTGGVWSADFTVSRTYDLAGNVLTQTYPSEHSVTYNYDAAGRLGDSGTQFSQLSFTGNLGDGLPRIYASQVRYQELGKVEQERFGTATPVYHKSFYNVRGQLAEIKVSTYAITDQTNSTNWNRGAIHNTYSALAGGTESREDNNGSLRRQKVSIPNDDQPHSFVDWSDHYTYDALNRLDKAEEIRAGQSKWLQDYDYDRWGNRTINQTFTTGLAPKPQFLTDQNTNRLYAPGDTALLMSQRQMQYDPAGNLIYDGYQGGGGTRAYDAESRMTTAQYFAGQTQTAAHAYDADGRRVRRMVGTSAETWQVYGMAGELLAEYAKNAAPTSPRKEYGYRGGEMLVTAEAATAGWGAAPVLHDNPLVAGQTRVQSRHITELRDAINSLRAHLGLGAYAWQTSATQGALVKADPIAEMRAALEGALGAPTGGYSAGLAQGQPIKGVHIQELRNRVLSAWQAGGTAAAVRWLVADQLGTPRMVLDQTGSLAGVTRHDYFPFGESIPADAPNGTLIVRTDERGYKNDLVRQKFTSYEEDAETGLDYAEARYFSPKQGRFSSVDPLMASADLTNPQTFNRYSYVVNSPMKYTDSTGLSLDQTGARCRGRIGAPDCYPGGARPGTVKPMGGGQGTGGDKKVGGKGPGLPNDDKRSILNPKERFVNPSINGEPYKGYIVLQLTSGMLRDLGRYADIMYRRGAEERRLFGLAMNELQHWAGTAVQLPDAPPLAVGIADETITFEIGDLLPVPANAGAATWSFTFVEAYNKYVKETNDLLTSYAQKFADDYANTTRLAVQELYLDGGDLSGGTEMHLRKGEKVTVTASPDNPTMRHLAFRRLMGARKAGWR